MQDDQTGQNSRLNSIESKSDIATVRSYSARSSMSIPISLRPALDSHLGEQLLGDVLRCCLTVSRRNVDAGRGLLMAHP